MTTRAALYARYSTDEQSESSIVDQFRECERVATREGMTVVARFSDEEISGGTAKRPGYQALLTAARAHEFDVIVAEDVSRLWRNRAEFGPRSAELEDLGVHLLTCVGDDTRRDGWGLTIQLKQMIAEAQRREASYRTRRGQEGVARSGKSAGGRAYGYIPAAQSGTGREEINEEQGAVVRNIFETYANGSSPRVIAATLNAGGVASPGSAWKRTKRRQDGRWLASSVLAILNNPKYIGLIRWGVTQWDRSAADSSVRRVKQLASPRVERTEERLRIVPQELWGRVKVRQQQQSHDLGVRVRTGLRKRCTKCTHLLSGSLRCQECGSSFAMSGGQRYQCAGHVGGAGCSISLSVPRDRIERVFRTFMAGPELPRVLTELEAQWLSGQPMQVDYKPQIERLERQRANLVEAIKTGGLAAELGAELKKTVSELELLKVLDAATSRASRSAPQASVEKRVEQMLKRLEEGGEAARHAVRSIFPGGIWLRPHESGKFLVAHARTSLPSNWLELRSANGLPAKYWPRVYDHAVGQEGKVARSGSGGRI